MSIAAESTFGLGPKKYSTPNNVFLGTTQTRRRKSLTGLRTAQAQPLFLFLFYCRPASIAEACVRMNSATFSR